MQKQSLPCVIPEVPLVATGMEELASRDSGRLIVSEASGKISYVDAKSYLWTNAEASKSMQYKKPEGELVIFPVLENGNSTFKLAYKFDIYATAPVSRGYVYINAHNGGFLYNEPIIKHFNNVIDKVSESYSTSAESNSNSSRKAPSKLFFWISCT